MTDAQMEAMLLKCPACKVIIDGNQLIGTLRAICSLTNYKDNKIPDALLAQAGRIMQKAEQELDAVLIQMGMS